MNRAIELVSIVHVWTVKRLRRSARSKSIPQLGVAIAQRKCLAWPARPVPLRTVDSQEMMNDDIAGLDVDEPRAKTGGAFVDGRHVCALTARKGQGTDKDIGLE